MDMVYKCQKIKPIANRQPLTTTRGAGFTLVEMMVTVAIFALISSVLLARSSKFDDEVLLQSASYDVALTIRTAQNYGIDVLGSGDDFSLPYGVYFQSGSPTYYLFRDIDDSKTPNLDPESGEVVETYQLGRSFSVRKVCSFSGTPGCTEATLHSDAAILFRRPEPDAEMYTIDGESGIPTQESGVVIEIASPRGGQRFISVQETGQMGVLKATQIAGDSSLDPL